MSTASPIASDTDRQTVELLLRFTRSAHEAGGYPANELEPRVAELGDALGLHGVQVSATPTVVEIAVGSIPQQQVYVLRVKPHPVDLYTIGRLDEISAAVADGRIDRRRALDEISELHGHPLRRPRSLVVLVHGVIGAALAPIVGGGWRESIGAALVGLTVGFLTRVILRGERFEALVSPLGAFVASFFASVLACAGFGIAVANVTFAALVVLLPGMLMVIGIRELAAHHLEAGVANSVGALVQLVGLAFGVAVGRSLVATWLGPIPTTSPEGFGVAVKIIAAAVVGLGFVITLRASLRDARWTCGAAVLAIVANLVTSAFFGEVAGVFVASLVVGIVGNVIGRRLRHSSLAFIVPGLLMLVPASIGFESADNLLAGWTLTGIGTAFDTIVTLLAIAYGFLAATIALPIKSPTSPAHTAS
ncbi:MAG: threonine/serine exporter family protein [Kofleriaceae bacterium]|nr:threonine/serine exporter family protein [Kofleriaceae bacterium]